MTRDEAIKVLERAEGYIGIHYINGVEDPYINPCLLKSIDFAISALREQEERRWIPVTERLPGNDDFVLVSVCGKAGCITLENATELAQFSMDEGWILEMWPEWEDPKVTHWMPLPEAPEMKGNDSV